MAFTDTWDATFVGAPLDPDYVGMGAYEIRRTKRATAERMGVLKLQTGSNWDTRGYTLGVANGTVAVGVAITSAGFTYAHSADFELEQSSDVLLEYRARTFMTNDEESSVLTYRFEVDSSAMSSFVCTLGPNIDVYYPKGRQLVMRTIASNLSASTHTVRVEGSSDNVQMSLGLSPHRLTIAPIWTD